MRATRIFGCLLAAPCLLLALASTGRADPRAELAATVKEYRSLVTDCGGDLALLKRKTDRVESMLPEIREDPSLALDAYINLAKFNFLLGEMGQGKDDRIKSYQQCGRYGEKAVEMDEGSAEAHFWYFSGLAREAELKGILKAVVTGTAFKVKGQIKKAYELDDKDPYILSGLGNYYWKAPRMIGGSKKKAREYLEEAVRADPRLSFARVTLAKVLVDLGRKDQAREELARLLDLEAPSDPNFYQFVNKGEAVAQLKQLTAKK